MNVLLDTHVAIWALNEPRRLPGRIRDLLETQADLVAVSHISLWEIGIKYPLSRRDAPPRSTRETLEDVVAAGFELLPLGLEHVLAFERLPRLHGDPMDRLLIAQALVEGLSFVTHDGEFAAYGETIISW